MARYLKDIIAEAEVHSTEDDGYEPRAEGEKRFKKKHVIVKHKDPAGNGDDVFKATNVKKAERFPDHGYEPKQDHQFYESIQEELKALKARIADIEKLIEGE